MLTSRPYGRRNPPGRATRPARHRPRDPPRHSGGASGGGGVDGGDGGADEGGGVGCACAGVAVVHAPTVVAGVATGRVRVRRPATKSTMPTTSTITPPTS